MNVSSSVPFDLHGPLVDIRNSFGVLLIGGTASTGLLGITTLQTWFYFRNYSTDNLLTKSMVILIWCIELTRTAIIVRAAYYYLVLNWGNPAALDINNWSLNTLPLTSTCGELFGHSYFLWRIWKLSRVRIVRWMLSILVATFAAWNFAMGVTEYMISSRAIDLAAFGSGSQKVISPLALAVAAATDVAIMVSLVFLLHHTRSGHSRTEHIINMLMLYTVQAGLLTAVADTVIIVLNHYIDRIGSTYIGVYSIVGNLYANSLLASLNARTSLRAGNNNGLPISVETPGVWKAAIPTLSSASTVPPSDDYSTTISITDSKGSGDVQRGRMPASSKDSSGEKDIGMADSPMYELTFKG